MMHRTHCDQEKRSHLFVCLPVCLCRRRRIVQREVNNIVLCALRCVPMNAAKQRSDHTSCRCFIFCKLTNQTAQAFVSPAREVSSLLYSRASTMALIAARSRTSQARISRTSWTSSDSSIGRLVVLTIETSFPSGKEVLCTPCV